MSERDSNTQSSSSQGVWFYGDLLVALSRLAGNRQSDGTSSTVSREDREIILNSCHNLMITLRTQLLVTDEMVERAAMAMCEAWHYSPIGTPDGDAEWKRKQDQYRKQARAALISALSAKGDTTHA